MSNIRTFKEPSGAWVAVDGDQPGRYSYTAPTEAEAIRCLNDLMAPAELAALRELIPTLPVARDVANSDAVMRVYACPEYEELSQDGQAWADALVAEARRPLIEAIIRR
jgi:hypothetical protein